MFVSDSVPGSLTQGQLDAVVAVFVLSAIAPDKHADVVARLVRLLKPGSGVALVRDYGRCVSARQLG